VLNPLEELLEELDVLELELDEPTPLPSDFPEPPPLQATIASVKPQTIHFV
jgi:hypothetical protein